MHALSNSPPQFERLSDLFEQLRGKRPRRRPKPLQRQTRLTSDQVALLLERYRKGERAYRLASEFGIHRETVAAILVRAGLRRPRSMTVEERAEAIQLYNKGLSCADIGKELGRDSTTIWRALKAAGIKLRDEQGRTR